MKATLEQRLANARRLAKKLRRKLAEGDAMIRLAEETVTNTVTHLSVVRAELGIHAHDDITAAAGRIREHIDAMQIQRADLAAVRDVLKARPDESAQDAAIRWRTEHPKRKVKAKRR
jgi:hypothetical protein